MPIRWFHFQGQHADQTTVFGGRLTDEPAIPDDYYHLDVATAVCVISANPVDTGTACVGRGMRMVCPSKILSGPAKVI